MTFSTALEFPVIRVLALSNHLNDLVCSSSSQTRDISIKDYYQRYDRNDIGKEQMSRGSPEVEGCNEEQQGPYESDGNKR